MATQNCNITTSNLVNLSVIDLSDTTDGKWNGIVTPTLTGPWPDGDRLNWNIAKDWGSDSSPETKTHFINYCGGQQHIFSPYTLDGSPSSMYFFFGLNYCIPYGRLFRRQHYHLYGARQVGHPISVVDRQFRLQCRGEFLSTFPSCQPSNLHRGPLRCVRNFRLRVGHHHGFPGILLRPALNRGCYWVAGSSPSAGR